MMDAKKAFDRVDWQFVKWVLILMKFGEGFLTRIQLIYKDQQAIISGDGYNSNRIQVRRGVR